MAEGKEMPFLDPNPFHDEEQSSQRKSGDFSETKSEYEDIDPVKTNSEVQTYVFSFTSTHRHIQVISEKENNPTYYAEFSLFTPGKPDVTLRAGGDDKGDVVGLTKLRMSREFKIGIGDPNINGGNDMLWEDVEFQGNRFKDPQYVWTMSPYGGLQNRRSFRWKKTSYLNWKLVDEESGEVRATFQSNGLKSWSKMGRMKVSGDLGRELETAVMLTMLGMFEKARRRRS
jgi:hypothetical protein